MISLVSTVLNDCQGLRLFFQQIELQTRRPDELVIVDAGSNDGTWELIRFYDDSGKIPIKYCQDVGCNVARGRNIAIEMASYQTIVSTDIGCEWDFEWLEELVAPLDANPSVEYVVGSWAVKPSSVVTPWAKTELAMRGHVFQATPTHNASSRSVAYRKSAWEKVGGYPEDLTLAADDMVFDLLIKKHSIPSACAPTVRCYWHRFNHLKQYLKEERRNFWGNGEAFVAKNHFILVGGRLALEVLGLLSTLFLWTSPPLLYLGVAGLAFTLCSIALRAVRFMPNAKRLEEKNVPLPLLRILVFDYLTKTWGLWGYARGFFHGMNYCQDCRHRLHRAD